MKTEAAQIERLRYVVKKLCGVNAGSSAYVLSAPINGKAGGKTLL